MLEWKEIDFNRWQAEYTTDSGEEYVAEILIDDENDRNRATIYKREWEDIDVETGEAFIADEPELIALFGISAEELLDFDKMAEWCAVKCLEFD